MIRVKTIDISATVTTITIATEIGEFEGRAYFNEEVDTLNPSEIIGCRIAENRAKIKYYKEKIRRKKYEMKGIDRLIAAMPSNKSGYTYAVRLRAVIQKEIDEYIAEWNICERDINAAIEGRAMYVRSRTIDKKERDKFFKDLGNALKQLDTATKDKKVK